MAGLLSLLFTYLSPRQPVLFSAAKKFSQAGRTPLHISVVCRAFAQQKSPGQGMCLDGTLLPLADCGQGRLCRAKARRFSEGGFACRSV